MSMRDRWRAYCVREARTCCGITFHDDGTAEGPDYARSPVLEVVFTDGRDRKSGLGRAFAGALTGGANYMLSGPYHGSAQVTVVTEAWVHTQSGTDGDELQRLYGLAVTAKARA